MARNTLTAGDRFIQFREALGCDTNVAWARRHGISEATIRAALLRWGDKKTISLGRTWRTMIIRDGGNLEFIEKGTPGTRPLDTRSNANEALRRELEMKGLPAVIDLHLELLQEHARAREILGLAGLLGQDGEVDPEHLRLLRDTPGLLEVFKKIAGGQLAPRFFEIVNILIAQNGKTAPVQSPPSRKGT